MNLILSFWLHLIYKCLLISYLSKNYTHRKLYLPLYFYMFSNQIIKKKLSQYWRLVRISSFKWRLLCYSSLTIVKDKESPPESPPGKSSWWFPMKTTQKERKERRWISLAGRRDHKLDRPNNCNFPSLCTKAIIYVTYQLNLFQNI